MRVQSVALAESPHAKRILGVKTAENYATGFRAYVRSSEVSPGPGTVAESAMRCDQRAGRWAHRTRPARRAPGAVLQAALREHLMTTSGRGGDHRKARALSPFAGGYTYEPPPGVVWEAKAERRMQKEEISENGGAVTKVTGFVDLYRVI